MSAAGWSGAADQQVQHLDEGLMRHRLAHARFARLAFTAGEQPLIVPVNISSDGATRVVFHTSAGGILGALDGRPVAIEIDGHDAGLRTGWSVLVLGTVRDVTEGADPEARMLRAVPVDCWAPGEHSRIFAVVPQSITGRLVPVGADGDWFPGVPSS